MSKFMIVIQQTILNYKYIFTNKGMLFLTGAFLMFPIILCLIFIPFRFILPIVFVVGALLPATLMYIERSFAWKVGSVDQHLRGTKVSGTLNNISLFIFFAVNTYALSFILILSFHILGISHLLTENWFGGRMQNYDDVIKLFNAGMMYSIMELIIVMYAIVYFFLTFIKSHKVMYIIIMSLVVLEIVYGATFNNYFRDIGKLNVDQNTGEFDTGVVFYSRGFFPSVFYYPTVFIFPLYAPSQHIETNKFVIDEYSELQFFHWSNPNDMITYWHLDETFRVGDNAFKWNVLWIAPYIHVTCLVTAGRIIKEVKKEA